MTSIPDLVLGYNFANDPSATDRVSAANLQTQLQLITTYINSLRQQALDPNIRGDNSIADQLVLLRMLSPEVTNLIASKAGWQPKTAAALYSATNIVLSGEQVIDTVTTNLSRVVVNGQTLPAQNGIYLTGPGAWTRATDAATAAQLGYSYIRVSGGGIYGSSVWVLTQSVTDIILGTTSLTFAQGGGGTASSIGTAVGTVGTIAKYAGGLSLVNSLLIDAIGTGALTLIKTGVTPRSVTFPDASVSIPAGTLLTGTLATPNRLDSTSAAGVVKESQIADGVTGNVLTIGGILTALRSQLAQDKTGTIALHETSTVHGYKNLLHNGRVLVDQRGTLTTPATVTTGTPTYGPDGWLGNKTNGTMVATIGKVAVVNTPMVGSLDACKLNITTLAAVAIGDSLSIQRRIEGTFFRRCNFGTAQAAAIYVSFWIEASATGTFSVALRNGAAARSYVVNFTIAAANTRQLCQVTIPGDTTGTWATDTSNAAFLDITAAVGATFQTTPGAWQAGNFFGTSSATLLNNLVGSISISDLYLGTEPIGTATSDYPHLPFDEQLRRCQRYLPALLAPSSISYYGAGSASSALNARIHFNHPVQARAASTGIITAAASTFFLDDSTTSVACTSFAWNQGGLNSTTLTVSVAAGLTQFRPYFLYFQSTSFILFTGAEL